RIAAWISAAGASTSLTGRSNVQHSSSITVGSSGVPTATTSSPLLAIARGNRQCSSRYFAERRWASGPAAAARRSAAARGGSAGPGVGTTCAGGPGDGSGAGAGAGPAGGGPGGRGQGGRGWAGGWGPA